MSLTPAFLRLIEQKASYGKPLIDAVMDEVHDGRRSIASGKIISGEAQRDHRYS